MLKKGSVLLLFIAASVIWGAEAKTAFARSQEMLKVKDPAAWAEIQKLAATDMDAAVKKMQESAAKHKINLVFSTITATVERSSGNGRFGNRGGQGNRGGRFGNRGGQGNRNGRFGNRDGQGERGGRFGNRGGQGNRNGMMMGSFFSRIIAENEIRIKFPAEVDALNKTLLEAESKYAGLAKKAGVTLNENIDSKLRRLQTLAPEEMAQIIAAMKNNDFSAFQKLNELAKKHNITLMSARSGRMGAGGMQRGNGSDARGNSGRQTGLNISRLRRMYPEEMKKYDALRSENPAEARKLLLELVRRNNGTQSQK